MLRPLFCTSSPVHRDTAECSNNLTGPRLGTRLGSSVEKRRPIISSPSCRINNTHKNGAKVYGSQRQTSRKHSTRSSTAACGKRRGNKEWRVLRRITEGTVSRTECASQDGHRKSTVQTGERKKQGDPLSSLLFNAPLQHMVGSITKRLVKKRSG